MNDDIGPYFKTFNGLRQGDSLSSLLFELVVDSLAIILDKGRTEGFVKGVLTDYHENGVNMLQYPDDTIFLIQDDEDSAKYLKVSLTAVE